MVVDSHDTRQADQLFHAFSDATRRDIVMRAIHGEHTVSSLARRYPMSFAAVQKHVAVLEQAELVTKTRRGRQQLVRTNLDGVRRTRFLLDQLESVWRSRIDQIGEIVAELDEGATP